MNLSARDNPKSFSQEIMDELMPLHYITPKIALLTFSKETTPLGD